MPHPIYAKPVKFNLVESISNKIGIIVFKAKCIYNNGYTLCEGIKMEAKIFQSGNSQAVRIPKEFRFDVSEVEIFKRGDEVILKPKPKNLGAAFKLLGEMPSDFMQDGREDSVAQEREAF